MNTPLLLLYLAALTIVATWFFIVWGKEPVRHYVYYLLKVGFVVVFYTVLVALWITALCYTK